MHGNQPFPEFNVARRVREIRLSTRSSVFFIEERNAVKRADNYDHRRIISSIGRSTKSKRLDTGNQHRVPPSTAVNYPRQRTPIPVPNFSAVNTLVVRSVRTRLAVRASATGASGCTVRFIATATYSRYLRRTRGWEWIHKHYMESQRPRSHGRQGGSDNQERAQNMHHLRTGILCPGPRVWQAPATPHPERVIGCEGHRHCIIRTGWFPNFFREER